MGALEECTLANVWKQLAAAESVVSSLEINVCLSFFSPVSLNSKLDCHNAEKFPDASSENMYNKWNNKHFSKHHFFYLLAELRGKGFWFSVCSFGGLFSHMKTNILFYINLWLNKMLYLTINQTSWLLPSPFPLLNLDKLKLSIFNLQVKVLDHS